MLGWVLLTAAALSRSAAPTWVLLLVVMAAALVGPAGVRDRLRRGGWAAALAAVAVVGNRTWEAAYGPEVLLGLKAIPLGLERGLDQWWQASPGLVGAFGFLEYPLPLWIPLLWLAVALAVGVLAFRESAVRERRVLLGSFGVGLLLPLVLYVLVIRRTGCGLQGRHVLPVLVGLPLLAGELFYRARVTLRPWMLPAAMVSIAAVHAAAYWLNARRSAVGVDGPLLFLGDAEWEPPTGWLPCSRWRPRARWRSRRWGGEPRRRGA